MTSTQLPPPGFARYNPENAAQEYHRQAIEKAKGILTPGKVYRVTGGRMGRYQSDLELEDTEGKWDSALFDVDIYECPLKTSYLPFSS